MEDFLKGLEKIKSQQLEARESSKFGVYPFEGTDNHFSHYSTGIITPKDKHYLIDSEGDLSFTGTKFLKYEEKEAFPPFSAAELLLESKNDFDINYNEAVKYYNLNKDLAMKENENILSSKEYQPDHPITFKVNQEMNEIKTMMEEQGQDPSTNDEVSNLLDQHFSKIEKLLKEFSEKVDKASQDELPKLEENLTGKLNKIFADLKDGLKQLFVDMKDQVRSGIENKANDVKVNIHNAIAQKVQGVNDKIKNLTTSIDEKYQIIDKKAEKTQEDPTLVKTQKATEEIQKKEKNTQELPVVETDENAPEEVINRQGEPTIVVTQVASEELQRTDEKGQETPKEIINKDIKDQVSPPIEKSKEFQNKDQKVQEVPVAERVQENTGLVALKNENNKLNKEVAGFKTFVKVLRSDHPEVFNAIYNTMKNVQQGEQKQEQTEVKLKEKEVELQI
ncbi:hypothetical protein [Lederbergia lenta]|uniref:hypothetical protein n=1 Tax=Lederbergia lenta TaxID=1467 RepID=UPI00204117B7|nr:hypothetical protein [Lederbergia lenta]MCM3113652.1 hypothetical protein [Lederbergia lenta]